MSFYRQIQESLSSKPQQWLVTGGAGFIGSHVIEKLLTLGQNVRVLDDLSTGSLANLDAVRKIVGPISEQNLTFIEGDIRDEATLQNAMQNVDRVIHLAAMGSVSLSFENPEACRAINTAGTLQVFQAARNAGVKQVSYASSSAVYGDDFLEFKQEDTIGMPLSPYAESKRMNEIDARILATCFGFPAVGLRFFNIFGPRQDPSGAYAAVIPNWISAMQEKRPVFINGDGSNTRDFCFVGDVVQALILAATTENTDTFGAVFNVGLGKAIDLNELFETLQGLVEEQTGENVPPVQYRDFRPGDIIFSCADVSRARNLLQFEPEHSLRDGLQETVRSFFDR